jgi:hypothetical protein
MHFARMQSVVLLLGVDSTTDLVEYNRKPSRSRLSSL